MIRTENVTVVFPGGVCALRNVTLGINKGEFVFLVGSTGMGKSTFLKLVYRDVVPTEGKVLVGGRDVTRLPRSHVPALRRTMGVVFQDFQLLPQKTVWENVAFALEVIGAPRHQIVRGVPEALKLVGLSNKANVYPAELSGGEQQRASIARAIVNDPAILLADEPTGNLDPDTSWEITQLLGRINIRGTTVLVATHDQLIVDRMRKRVIEFDEGMVVRDKDRAEYRDETTEPGVLY